MKKILFFYSSRQLLLATLVITLVLSGALWFARSVKLVEMVVNGGAPLSMFFTLMGLSLPTFITPILPVCFCFAVLFVYTRFYQDSELIIMRSAGLSPYQLLSPVIIVALVVIIVHLSLTIHIAPWARRQLRHERTLIATEYSVAALREGTFNSYSPDLTVYVRERLSPDQFAGILIHDTRDPETAVTISATRGILQHNASEPRLIIHSGTRQEKILATGQINWLQFEEYAVNLSTFRPPKDEGFAKAEERSFSELLNPPGDINSQKNKGEFYAESHQRLSAPLWNVSYGLLALTVLLHGSYQRRGIIRRLTIAMLGALLLQGTELGLASMAASSGNVIPFMYLLPFGVALASWLFLRAAQKGYL